jgi:hypothetical protein
MRIPVGKKHWFIIKKLSNLGIDKCLHEPNVATPLNLHIYDVYVKHYTVKTFNDTVGEINTISVLKNGMHVTGRRKIAFTF